MPSRKDNPLYAPAIVGYVPPEQAARLGAATPIPILDIPLADERCWCKAALEHLDGVESVPCPTRDLRHDGSCRRSPRSRPCLLLLADDHPDWQAARRYRYDPLRNAITLREEPSPAETEPYPDPVLAQWRRLENDVAALLDELRAEGFPIAVDAAAVLGAELKGGTIDLETGEVER